MTTVYPVKLSVTLRPVWHQDSPLIRIGINEDYDTVSLRQNTTFDFDLETSETCELIIEFLNKKDSDTVPDQGHDKAVVIDSVSFFGITDPRFVWAGVYEPRYPEPWYSQQISKPKQFLVGHTYLGWNGKWRLTFDVPVFTWIHQTQNLGWIYG